MSVTVGEIEDVEKKVMEIHSDIEKASERICNIIDSMILNHEKLVLFEINGIGNLKYKHCMTQVHVALSLLKRFKEKNGKVRITSREPNHNDVEKEYLENKRIKVREVCFTAEDYLKATEDYLEASKGIQNSIYICYMLHGMPEMYEEYIAAHYNHINQIVFIGNEPKHILDYLKASKNLKMIDEVLASTVPKPLDMTGTSIPKHAFSATFIYRSNI
uniref:SRR1-like domain-containing protein n=1 Tax=Panagrolaimus davidi TaxID=227884 RepID=A0A914PZW2_9BILA